MDRRSFFRAYAGEMVDAIRGVNGAVSSIRSEARDALADMVGIDEADMPSFFDSHEYSYSLTLAYPRDMFEQMADNAGIDHEGRDTLDIARELHDKGVI